MYKVFNLENKNNSKHPYMLVFCEEDYEISEGLHVIGVKPPPKGEEKDVDTNGWYWIYEKQFHGYKVIGTLDEHKKILINLGDVYVPKFYYDEFTKTKKIEHCKFNISVLNLYDKRKITVLQKQDRYVF